MFEDTVMPRRATEGAAGYDVCAYLHGRHVDLMEVDGKAVQQQVEDVLLIPPGARVALPLGFKATLPDGIEAQLRLRSSTAFRKGIIIPNSPATVDPDYPGEWLLLVANMLQTSIRINHGERIAQIVFSRFEEVEWQPGTVVAVSNRAGGLGSTGL
jgi:dUTP pyrophosphatase